MAKRFNGEGSIRQRSNGSWEARYTNPITNKQQSAYGKTKQEVQKKLKEKLRELDELKKEKECSQKGELSGKNLTLNEWFDIYMIKYKKNRVKPQTYSTYYSIYNNWIKCMLGDTKLQEITYSQVVTILNSANLERKAKETIKIISTVFNDCMKEALKEGLIKTNPVVDTYDKKMGENKKTKRALTQDELNWFFRGLDERYPKNKFMFQLMLVTGIRVNELTALRWENVSSDFSFVSIEKTTTQYHNVDKDEYVCEHCIPKGNIKRIVSIIDDLKPLFKQHKTFVDEKFKIWNMSLNEDDFIFQKAPKEQFKYNSILKMIEHVLKYIYEEYNIKIERFTPHYLRHTFGTSALHSGMSIVDVQKIGGWKDSKTLLEVYAHTDKETMVKEINKLEIVI